MSATTAETNSILKYLSVCCFTQKWNTLHFIYQEPEISLHPAIPFTSIFWIIKLSLNKREFQSTDLFWNWPKFCHLFPALTANTSAHFNCKMACSSFIVRYFHSFDCIAQHTNTFHFMAIFVPGFSRLFFFLFNKTMASFLRSKWVNEIYAIQLCLFILSHQAAVAAAATSACWVGFSSFTVSPEWFGLGQEKKNRIIH